MKTPTTPCQTCGSPIKLYPNVVGLPIICDACQWRASQEAKANRVIDFLRGQHPDLEVLHED